MACMLCTLFRAASDIPTVAESSRIHKKLRDSWFIFTKYENCCLEINFSAELPFWGKQIELYGISARAAGTSIYSWIAQSHCVQHDWLWERFFGARCAWPVTRRGRIKA